MGHARGTRVRTPHELGYAKYGKEAKVTGTQTNYWLYTWKGSPDIQLPLELDTFKGGLAGSCQPPEFVMVEMLMSVGSRKVAIIQPETCQFGICTTPCATLPSNLWVFGTFHFEA